MPNIHEPHFDEPREHPGFVARRARLGRQAGAERLGLSLWDLPPGEAAYPYHFHLAEEELLIVLEGHPSLRAPDGWRAVEPGEVLVFPVGERGAHQLVNRTEAAVRLLPVSTAGAPDIVAPPASGKAAAFGRRPDGSGMRLWFREADAVNYHEGEEPPD